MLVLWWQSLSLLEQILLYIAVPATLILLIQTILLFVGGVAGGDADADASCDGEVLDSGVMDVGDGLDLDGDGIPDLELDADLDAAAPDAGGDAPGDGGVPHGEAAHAASGLHVLTVRGVIAFLTLFGWSGLAFCQTGMPALLAVFLAVPVGLAGMVAIALLLREALKLQYDGTLDLRNAVGLEGSVYLTVPARRAAPGKVNVLVQSQLREFEALTDSETPIPTGAEILVTALAGEDTLLVEEKK